MNVLIPEQFNWVQKNIEISKLEDSILSIFKKKGDEVVIYGLPPTQPEYHHAYWKKANKKLDKLGIKSRLLYHPDVTDKNLKNRNSYKLCQARRMPYNIESPSWVMVYKDVTLIAIPQGDMSFAFEINSQQVADSFRNYFEWFWKKAPN